MQSLSTVSLRKLQQTKQLMLKRKIIKISTNIKTKKKFRLQIRMSRLGSIRKTNSSR